MEFDRHIKFIWAPCAQLRPPPPPLAFGLIYEGAISQPRKTTSLWEPLAICFLMEFEIKSVLPVRAQMFIFLILACLVQDKNK
jgi:hypothetical protein